MIRNLVLGLCTAALLGSLAPAQSIDGRAFDQTFNRISERSNRRGLSKETRREMKWALKQLAQLKRKRGHSSQEIHEITSHLKTERNEVAERLDVTHTRLHTLELQLKQLSQRLTTAHPSVVQTKAKMQRLKEDANRLSAKLKSLDQHSEAYRQLAMDLYKQRSNRHDGFQVHAPSQLEEELEEPIVEEEEIEEEEEVVEEPIIIDEEVVEKDASDLRRFRELDIMKRNRVVLEAELERVQTDAVAARNAMQAAANALDRERTQLEKHRAEMEFAKAKALEQAMVQMDRARAELDKAKGAKERAAMEKKLAMQMDQLALRKADIQRHHDELANRRAQLDALHTQLDKRARREAEMADRQSALQARLEALKGLENRGARKAIYEEQLRMERESKRSGHEQKKGKQIQHQPSPRSQKGGSGAHRHRDLESQLNELRNEMQEFKDMLKQLHKRDPRRRSSKLH